jgi:hypothetical protein
MRGPKGACKGRLQSNCMSTLSKTPTCFASPDHRASCCVEVMLSSVSYRAYPLYTYALLRKVAELI